jgi:hypothetical protein
MRGNCNFSQKCMRLRYLTIWTGVRNDLSVVICDLSCTTYPYVRAILERRRIKREVRRGSATGGGEVERRAAVEWSRAVEEMIVHTISRIVACHNISVGGLAASAAVKGLNTML